MEEGKTQRGLINNLFAAPVFRHETEPTDFLMILGQLTKLSNNAVSLNSGGGGGGLGTYTNVKII